MVHQRQRLPLRLKVGDHLRRVHARLDDLQRDHPPNRLLLLGHPDDAHPALADLLEQLVRPDPRAGPLGQRRHGVRVEPLAGGQYGQAGFPGRGPLEEAAGRVVSGEQGFDALTKVGLAGAGFVEIGGTLLG